MADPPPDEFSGNPQPSADSSQMPLSELDSNGESLSDMKAAPMKASSPRSSMGPSLRKIKKKKSSTKNHPYSHLSHEEVLHGKMEEAIYEARENMDPRGPSSLGLEELVSKNGLAAAVQPLQSVAYSDVQFAEGEDDVYSDEEEEEFDLESYQANDERRAELVDLMERYGVYDEEQLRLAVRRERKQEKSLSIAAGMSTPSSESAPASPTGNSSRFIPPFHANIQPRLEDLIAEDTSHIDGKFISPPPIKPTFHINHPTANISMHDPRSTSMQSSSSLHVPLGDVEDPLPNTHNPHATSQSPVDSQNGPHQTDVLLGMHNPSTPSPPNPNLENIESPTHPHLSAHLSAQSNMSITQQLTDQPMEDCAPSDLPTPSHSRPTPIKTTSPPPKPIPTQSMQQVSPIMGQAQHDEALKFFSNNPLATGILADFPPLPKSQSVQGNGGVRDIVMASVEEGEPQPNGDRGHANPSISTEQSRRSTLVSAPRPPTSLAERVKNSAPPLAPVAFNPSKYTPIGAKGDREGTPVISFSKTDTECLAGRVGLAVVGKFSHSIPSSHNINKALNNIPIKGTLMWNFLNAKHVLIRLSDAEDYAKLLHGVNGMPVWYVESVPMRVFKWTPEFDPSFETPIVAVWCNLPALPIHLYDQRALYMICSSLGNPIQVDHATASRSRITFARVCVEIDITKPPVEEFVIDMAGTEVRQKVVWDKIPRYCSDCKHVGHLPESCYAFGRNARPDKKPAPQARAPGSKTKSVLRPSSLAQGAAAPSAPPTAPISSSGASRNAPAPGERSAVALPRSPSRGHDRSGVLGPMPGSSGTPASLTSPHASSSSGLRPLRLGERSLRSDSRSPSRVPVAPGAPMALGARGAPRSPPRSPAAPVVSGARGAPRSPPRGSNALVVPGDPQRRHASPRAPHGRASPDASLGEWIEVAQSKHKMPAREGVADVPIKNSFRVLDDGTEVLMADYESEDDRDVEMTDDNRDMVVDSVQGSSIPNRGRVLPASLGGNLRSGVSAPASS